jgi:ParB-like chromosome segregation protein Spo0J
MELSVKTLSIDYQPVSALKPRATNPRTHSNKQITQIANAIRRFGFTNPVLVDDANGIVAGHGRIEAAKIVGLGYPFESPMRSCFSRRSRRIISVVGNKA